MVALAPKHLPAWQPFVASQQLSAPQPSMTLASVGLLSGQPITATLALAPVGSGLTFVWSDGLTLPATLAHIIDTRRGTTLGLADPATGKVRPLAIVEHYLAATCLAQLDDITLTLPASATELPLLDGSAWVWYQALLTLRQAAGMPPPLLNPSLTHTLTHALSLADVTTLPLQEGVSLSLSPHDSGFKGSYTLNYPDTPALNGTTGHWQVGDDPNLLVASQTFGHVAELPALQAKGYALGVSAENTLGLLDNGEFTRPLRHASEPHLHKLLDFMGDFRLTGINPLNVAMQVQAVAAGHSTHIALAQHAVQTHALRPLP